MSADQTGPDEGNGDGRPKALPLVMLTAADVERFAYCPLNFLRSKEGEEAEGPEVEAGRLAHEEASKGLTSIKKGDEEMQQMELIVLIFAVVASILASFAISFIPFVIDNRFGLLLSVIALIWLLAASVFLFLAENVGDPGVMKAYEKLIVASAIIAMVVILVSISLTFIQNTEAALIAMALALLWLVGATVYFYRVIRRMRQTQRKRKEMRVEGEVAYADSEVVRQPLLVAERPGLCGRPDLVLKRSEKHIPVELKTGRVPAGPHWSHILQVVAYCRLIEEKYGSPPYGILRYGQREFTIEYTEDLRASLLKALGQMRTIMQDGVAHRNHNRPGKCHGCSRRDGCPERLDAGPATSPSSPSRPSSREQRPDRTARPPRGPASTAGPDAS